MLNNDSHKKKDSKGMVKEKLLDFTNKRQHIIKFHAMLRFPSSFQSRRQFTRQDRNADSLFGVTGAPVYTVNAWE